jgi:hypothetical protein
VTDLPSELGGTHPLSNWGNRILRGLRRRTLLTGLGYKVRQTEAGVIMEILPGGAGSASTAFKLFRITVADSGGDGINVNEIRIGEDGVIETISAFGTIAKPLQLRAAFKPATDAVINPGYVPGTYTSIQIGAGMLPLAPDIIIGFRPAYGTGIEGIEWQDTGIFRHWAIPIVACRAGVPITIYVHLN